MQIDHLRDSLNQGDLEGQLKSLPRDLDEIYDRIVSGIIQRYGENALKILEWLSFTFRPLQLAEIAQVAGVIPDAEQGLRFEPSQAYANPRSALAIFSSLVTEIDGEWSK